MARRGESIGNPKTGEKVTWLETTQDTNGELLRFEWIVPPRFFIPEHVHPHQEERHEILSGTLWARVGGREQIFREGQKVVGPPGVPHSWRNPSINEELRLVSEMRGEALREFEALFETSYGLARDGKTTKSGVPKNPLQLAVLVSETKNMFYFTQPPMPVQRPFLALFEVLASIGRLLGYKARYPQYSDSGSSKEEQRPRSDALA